VKVEKRYVNPDPGFVVVGGVRVRIYKIISICNNASYCNIYIKRLISKIFTVREIDSRSGCLKIHSGSVADAPCYGAISGVTLLEELEAGPVPIMFVAVTVNV
jgi:hypothetical protein